MRRQARSLAREADRVGKADVERQRLEKQGVSPERAALEAQQKVATPRRPRAGGEPSYALLNAADAEIQSKLASGGTIPGVAGLKRDGATLLSIPNVPRAKRSRTQDHASSALSRMLAHAGDIPKLGSHGGANSQQEAIAAQQNPLSSRWREPLSTLEQYVVDTALRYNTIVESAWWQSQCYLV